MKLTQQEALIQGLQKRGFIEQPKTAHYRVFKGMHPIAKMECYFFLGKNGALRHCVSGRVTRASVCSTATRSAILGE